jgi:multidrug efflux pump
VLVGLACKNAILIVEFARQLHQAGQPRFEATLQACRFRLRPILMTSFAFILGVVPLVVATGAGAEMRQSLGRAVFAGMLGVTLFGIFLTPVFFYVLQGLSEMQLFASATIRRVGSLMAGGLAGLAVGFLLARLTHQRLAWQITLAIAAAALSALVVLALGRLANGPVPRQAPVRKSGGGQQT